MSEEIKPRLVVTDHLDGSYPNARDYEVNGFISDGLYDSDGFRGGQLRDVLGRRACEHTENLMVAFTQPHAVRRQTVLPAACASYVPTRPRTTAGAQASRRHKALSYR